MKQMLIAVSVVILLSSKLFAEPLPYRPVEVANSWWYTPIGDKLYFAGYQYDENENIKDIGVWSSDGTESGTSRISKDIFSYLNEIRIFDEKIGNKIFYAADTESNGSNELYYVDESSNDNYLIGQFNELTLSRTVEFLRSL